MTGAEVTELRRGSRVVAGRGLIQVIVFGVLAGCGSKTPPGGAPQSQPVAEPVAPGSSEWSRAEACTHLDDEKLGVSAAVRLVRLAELEPLCVPGALTADHMRRLRLVSLGPERWALGLTEKRKKDMLRAPVLIAADGTITALAEGVEEELLVLYVSPDAEVFPHVATTPLRVLIVGEEVVPAIVRKAEQPVRFALRQEGGYSYVGLLAAGGRGDAEIARYIWDPYEMVFLGPAADRLPDPPGGQFQIDLKASRRLEPRGGEIPEPEENREPPPRRDEPGAV